MATTVGLIEPKKVKKDEPIKVEKTAPETSEDPKKAKKK